MEKSGGAPSGSGRARPFVVALLIIVVVVVAAAWFWSWSGTRRAAVDVVEAELRDSLQLALVVGSCNGDPEVTRLEETADEVRVEVVSDAPLFRAEDDCMDLVEVQLDEPLGDRAVRDLHSGQEVTVTQILNP